MLAAWANKSKFYKGVFGKYNDGYGNEYKQAHMVSLF